MFGTFVKGVGFAVSPRGRKVIRHAVAVARSDEARRVVAQARKVATSPEARRLAASAAKTAATAGKHAGTLVASPENRERVRQAARYVASHRP